MVYYSAVPTMNKLQSFLCWNISILFYINCSSAQVLYIPPSREIASRYESTYTFGIRELGNFTNITRCYFTSDAGIKGSFDVYKRGRSITFAEAENIYNTFNSDGEARAPHNQVTNHGQQGECKITLKLADNKGPTEWVLTPYNNPINGSQGNLSSITYKVNFYNKVPLIASRIDYYQQSSFINYMNFSQPINLTSCTLFGNTTLELHSESNISATPHSWQDEQTLDRVSSLGHGLCGFKFTNATGYVDRLEWSLTATDSEGKLYEGNFTSFLKSKPKNKKLEVRLGSRLRIECGDKYSTTEFYYLYNPSAELVKTRNYAYDSEFTTMKDIGLWICYVGNSYSMDTTPYIIEVVEIVDTKVITWVNETDHHVHFGCRLNINPKGIKICKMIKPNSEVLNLRPYTATDRYASIGTDFNKSVCSMQIQKPLQNNENGPWRCEIGIFSGEQTTGRIIEVNMTENIAYPKHLKVVTRLDEPFTVSCKVPYSSEFCDIQAPTISQNITIYQPELGICSITISRATRGHPGRWVCSFAQKIGVPNDEIIVEVSVADIITYNETVHGYLGTNTTLLCHASGSPLKLCQFTNPKGETYYIHNHQTSASLSYYGKGMEYGECGVKISNTTREDFGVWTCTAEIINKYGPISREIVVYQ